VQGSRDPSNGGFETALKNERDTLHTPLRLGPALSDRLQTRAAKGATRRTGIRHRLGATWEARLTGRGRDTSGYDDKVEAPIRGGLYEVADLMFRRRLKWERFLCIPAFVSGAADKEGQGKSAARHYIWPNVN
jgi:hypothetical protein